MSNTNFFELCLPKLKGMLSSLPTPGLLSPQHFSSGSFSLGSSSCIASYSLVKSGHTLPWITTPTIVYSLNGDKPLSIQKLGQYPSTANGCLLSNGSTAPPTSFPCPWVRGTSMNKRFTVSTGDLVIPLPYIMGSGGCQCLWQRQWLAQLEWNMYASSAVCMTYFWSPLANNTAWRSCPTTSTPVCSYRLVFKTSSKTHSWRKFTKTQCDYFLRRPSFSIRLRSRMIHHAAAVD